MIFRILYIIPALFRQLGNLIKVGTRDFNNRRRFSNSIIGEGSCFDRNVILHPNCRIYENCIINSVEIDSYTYVSRNCIIQNATIGRYCSISYDVIIGLGTHPTDRFSTSPVFYHKNNCLRINAIGEDKDSFEDYQHINIGNDVWMGARAIILDGVNVGNGACIATGAVVTKDVPPYSIVAGSPAKIIKYRLPEDKIKDLEKSLWWDKEPEQAYSMFRNDLRK